jgi:diaminohydroxyphosphoribosylaminopyrimidine deaminase/5-amino-6-(5-phosphoribosylamino)uracil reductase
MPDADLHTPTDLQHMQTALTLAEAAIGLSDPNPRVGCVLVAHDGRVIGRGHTQQAGGPHAEVMALRDARSRAEDAAALAGATAYVTLEPCAHHGRTPPCCDALIEAQLARVVVAITDPFPQVAGQGIARLRAAGIEVSTGLLAGPARELNLGFLSRVLRGRPWVRLKAAASLDGRTALPNGVSQWITGAEARADGHAWRRRAGAVLTGLGTAQADDPRLDVRLVATARQPLRVVLDSQLRLNPAARLLQPPGAVLLCCSANADAAQRERQQVLAALPGVELLAVEPDATGRPSLPAVLDALGRRGINELHVEAGAVLNGAFISAGLIDELLLYLAPKLLGPGRDIACWGPLEQLDAALQLEELRVQSIGADLRLLARPVGRLAGWLST